MEKGSGLIRIMVLAAFSAGLVIYILGLVVGFFQASTVYMFYWYTSNSYTFIPFFQFEVYPRLVLTVSPLPFYIDRLSPITIIFLIFAVSAVIFTFLKKSRTAILLSISAFLTTVTQFIVLTPLVGGEPAGLAVRFLLIVPTYYPLTLAIMYSSKSLYLIILPAFLFGTGMVALFGMLLREKIALISVIPVSGETFKTLRSIQIMLIALVPFWAFLFFWLTPIQQFLIEFPHYPLLVFNLQFFNSYPSFSVLFWVYYFSFYVLYYSVLIVYNRVIGRVAESCIPLLLEKLDKQKPVISLLEVKEKLGLESTNKMIFKGVLTKAARIGEKEGTIYFGVGGKYFYFKDLLSLIVRERIRNLGKADIYEIASEIQVDPKLLRTIYYRLRREMLFEDLRIYKNIITPLRRE